MEGPSLVILTEDLGPFTKKKVSEAQGTAKLDFERIAKSTFKEAKSWGKHLILIFDKDMYRIHFLMFGSYRINDARDREPKLRLTFKNGFVNFYSCAIRRLEKDEFEAYDWSLDLMSDHWEEKRAVKLFRSKGAEMICDVLMDQGIFPGLGNIIKNEILFKLKLHPETRVDELSSRQQLALVRETRAYSLQFYEWKKINQLKRNWKIFRKRVCPDCKAKLAFRKTGKGARVSYICEVCQKR